MAIVALLLLSACAVRQAPASVPSDAQLEPSAPAPVETATAPPGEETAEPVDDPESHETSTPAGDAGSREPTRWTLGLLDEPGTLLPFSPDGRIAAPIVEPIFPAPVLSYDYGYTTTGVLAEVPSEANGGVERRAITGFLDATGQFTATDTGRPTTTEQLVVTFHWNPALRWADGTPVTAEDSVFAYQEALRAPASPDAQALLEIVERYEAVDAYTTRATLIAGRIEPTYPLLAWPPLPRHILADAAEEAQARYARAPLGYGPYTFARATPGESIVLERNEHWPGAAMPEQLVFRFFATAPDLRAAASRGEVDVAVLERLPADLYPLVDQDAASGIVKATWLRGPIYEHLDFNLADPLLRDVRIRRAIAHAIDRGGIVKDIFGGKTEVLESWIFPEQRESAGVEQVRRYRYDPRLAGALLQEAGLVDRDGDGIRELSDGKPLTLTLMTTDTPQRIEIARRIETDLRAAGLAAGTETLALDQFYSPTGPLFRRQFRLALWAWIGAVDPGGLPLWSCTAIPSAENGFTGNNFAGWCSEAAEWQLRRATGSLGPRQRGAAYLRHQQLWSEDVPSVPLLQRPILVLETPGIQGVRPDALAPITWNVDDWRR